MREKERQVRTNILCGIIVEGEEGTAQQTKEEEKKKKVAHRGDHNANIRVLLACTVQ